VRALALDTTTGDLRLGGGRLVLAEGVEAVAQRLRCRLKLQRGEWFADTSIGVPWIDAILGQRGNERTAEAILRTAIATCPGVATLETFVFTHDPATRRSVAVFLVRTTDGATLRVTAGDEVFTWEAL